MKGHTQVTLGVIIFFSGAIFGSYLDVIAPSFELSDYLPSIVTLLAVFLGARYAFELQNSKSNREEVRKNMLALNAAVLCFSQMYDQLSSYKRQIIDPYRDRVDKQITMRPTKLESQEHLRIDAKSLAYIFDSTQAQALLLAMNAESSFFRSMATIEERSRIVFNEAHPRMNDAGVREGTAMTMREVEDILTHGLFVKLGRITDGVIEMVDLTLPMLKEASDGLASATKDIYPDQEPRSFEPVDTPERATAETAAD